MPPTPCSFRHLHSRDGLLICRRHSHVPRDMSDCGGAVVRNRGNCPSQVTDPYPEVGEILGSAGRLGTIGEPQPQMFAMVDGLVKELGNVVVVQTVDDPAACAYTLDETEITQQP